MLPKTITVAILALPDALPLGVLGPKELLKKINQLAGLEKPPLSMDPHTSSGCPIALLGSLLSPEDRRVLFAPKILSLDGAPVKYPHSVSLGVEGSIEEVAQVHLLFIPPAEGNPNLREAESRFVRCIQACYEAGSWVASYCSGVAFLARAGILDGRRATSHWAWIQAHGKKYPRVRWAPEKVVVEDGRIVTAGGAMSWMDLVLYLVEKFSSRGLALAASRAMCVDPVRPSQLPYASFFGLKDHSDPLVLKAQEWIEANYRTAQNLSEMARQCGASGRNLGRRFRAVLGHTPLAYLQQVRVEAAKRLLEGSDKTVEEIVAEVGYQDARSFRRLFKRWTSLSPASYRNRASPTVRLSPHKEPA